MNKLPTLFSRASTGALREWTIEHNENAFRTHSGQVEGKITTSKWYDVKATNVGRSNERTRTTSAVAEEERAHSGRLADALRKERQRMAEVARPAWKSWIVSVTR